VTYPLISDRRLRAPADALSPSRSDSPRRRPLRWHLPLLAAVATLSFGCRDTLSPNGAAIPINSSYVPNYSEQAPDVTTMTAPGMTVINGSLPTSSAPDVVFAHPILAEVVFSSSGSAERFYPLYNTW
jgi:hypothetical protein